MNSNVFQTQTIEIYDFEVFVFVLNNVFHTNPAIVKIYMC